MTNEKKELFDASQRLLLWLQSNGVELTCTGDALYRKLCEYHEIDEGAVDRFLSKQRDDLVMEQEQALSERQNDTT